jgi:hypothetical protein
MLIGATCTARDVADVGHPLVREIIDFLNSAQDDTPAKLCPICGSILEYRNSILTYRGKSWDIPLPLCIHCYSGARGRSLM